LRHQNAEKTDRFPRTPLEARSDQLRALHDALGRTFTERKFRFLNFVSDGNKNGIPAEKPN
jgi:hypothetical protein